MIKNNSKDSSLWKKFLKTFKSGINFLKKNNQKFSLQYPNFLQTFQLTFVYVIAIISLLSSLLNILGEIPDFFLFFIPQFLQDIIDSSIIKFILAPEKSYIVYLLVIEFVIFRSLFNFSQLFKYNLLLIFLLEMFQNLLVGYWDLFFTRTVIGESSTTDIGLGVLFVSILFFFFFLSYIYGYFYAIRGKFVTFPYMYWLTDSIALWLQIKTPTMGTGTSKKKDKRK
jgi:hypothetical protein